MVQQYSLAEAGQERNQLFKITFLKTEGNHPIYHHTNYSNIVQRAPHSDLNTVLTVAYFAHSTCIREERQDEYDIDQDGNTTEVIDHWPDPCLGLAHLPNRLATLLKYDDQAGETQIMFHEFGHLCGAPDHYDDGVTKALNDAAGSQIYNDYCIYGKNNDHESVESSFKICDGCKAAIISNRDRYSHEE